MRIDLTSANLVDLDFSHCRVDEAIFTQATFTGAARFAHATFEGVSRFDSAIFTSNAIFDRSTFDHAAWFPEAFIEGDARFNGTDLGGTSFRFAIFRGDVSFHQATVDVAQMRDDLMVWSDDGLTAYQPGLAEELWAERNIERWPPGWKSNAMLTDPGLSV